MRPTAWLILGASILAPIGVAACGDDSVDDSAATTTTGQPTGVTGTGGSGGNILTGAGNGSQGGGDTGGGDFCAGVVSQAQLAAIDMYIMLDQSGSMNQTVEGGTATRWEAVTSAIDGFVNTSPETDGLGVGLEYFPLFVTPPVQCDMPNDCTNGGVCVNGYCLPEPEYACGGADYSSPEVPIGTLPTNADAITASLSAHEPFGGTPTAPALQGAIDHAISLAQADPSRKPVVVLATDGEPMNCTPTDIDSIANIASAAYNGVPSIRTFVIGVGSSLTNLNAIAVAGGTGQAFLVDDADVTQPLIDALLEIGSTLGCQYLIPAPTSGEIDFSEVNVLYTPGGGSTELPILYVGDLESCDPETGGWYYDNPAVPTQIIVCPMTCATFEADSGGTVEIQLGCETIIPS